MLKLYGGGANRWVKPYWTLQELGIPFEKVRVSIADGNNRTPDFLARNPFGKLPVLEDGDVVLRESFAICSYLVDKHPEKGLAPPPGTIERARVDQWMAFCLGDLEQPLWRIMRHRFLYDEARRIPAEIEVARQDFRELAATLSDQLRGDFIAGDRFTVADIALTYTLRWSRIERVLGKDLLASFPRLIAYIDKHMTRPAFPTELYG